MRLKCIKSLFKSTYKRNAFTRGKEYEVVNDSVQYGATEFILVRDNIGGEFSFSREATSDHYYYVDNATTVRSLSYCNVSEKVK